MKNISAAYIMKCDDDTFVRVNFIMGRIKLISTKRPLYLGNLNLLHRPLRYGKWAVSFEVQVLFHCCELLFFFFLIFNIFFFFLFLICSVFIITSYTCSWNNSFKVFLGKSRLIKNITVLVGVMGGTGIILPDPY